MKENKQNIHVSQQAHLLFGGTLIHLVILTLLMLGVYTFCLRQLALCTAPILPELQPAPCFLSAVIG